MSDIYFASDHHLFHKNILHFKDDAGNPVRPFASLEEMHETLIENHNKVVKPSDIIYFGGDVAFSYGPELAALMARFNGKKRLLLGNHDVLKGTNLSTFFKKITLVRHFKEMNMWCSHIPMHKGSFRHKALYNLHGHTHQNDVLKEDGTPDPQYINFCLEKTDFTPVNFDWIKSKMIL